MDDTARRSTATELMASFAETTGVMSDRVQHRYLWTDAFAVCNFVGLARRADDQTANFRALAARLVDRVHETLGKHRPDDMRKGWISGLEDAQGRLHPTIAGLRIGKPLPERKSTEPFEERLEWDRDGQYFHYLTRWMHALDRYALATRDPTSNRWARELAATAHAAFTYSPARGALKRMCWKMSIDLTRPLVASMGQHDPLDGLITFFSLRAHRGAASAGPALDHEIAEMASIARETSVWTQDPLGLGGLFTDALRLGDLAREGAAPDCATVKSLLDVAASGLQAWLAERALDADAEHRLAFRELGLAIGLHAVERLDRALRDEAHPLASDSALRASIERLCAHAPVAERIESFWLAPDHQHAPSWIGHEDINTVMLATSLAPEGYLSGV